jgi:hypothetical protein
VTWLPEMQRDDIAGNQVTVCHQIRRNREIATGGPGFGALIDFRRSFCSIRTENAPKGAN